MKKLFLILFVGLIGLISFCSAGQYTFKGISTDGIPSYLIFPQTQFDNNVFLHCEFGLISSSNCGGSAFQFKLYFGGNRVNTHLSQQQVQIGDGYYSVLCGSTEPVIIDYDFSTYTPPGGYFSTMYGISWISIGDQWQPSGSIDIISYSCTLSGQYVMNSCTACSPQYTSEECQAEYGLVTSGVLNQCNNNLLSCQSSLSGCQSSLSGRNNTLNNCSNNLLSCESSLASCIQSNCPIDTGNVMWSSLWINGIQHLGKPVINISIPDNIYWDYTTNDEEFDLYVGSGYDQDYIDGIISINSYSPTSEDFTGIFVSGLTLIMPYIIFALFIVFLWKLIKRIFK